MTNLFKNLKKNFVLWLFAFLIVPLFVWGFSFSKAADDLLWIITQPAYDYDIIIWWLWENVDTVWKRFFKWSTEIAGGVSVFMKSPVKDANGNMVCRWWACSADCVTQTSTNQRLCQRQWKMQSWLGVSAWVGIGSKPSTIVRITRMLLVVVIALSVTMILYNWMMYIVETWQWKDWKSLKNIAYIVAGILIALFSVIIIRIIESIPSTLWDLQELPQYWYEQDKDAVSQNERWAGVGVQWRL